jgi:hypothetical protein
MPAKAEELLVMNAFARTPLRFTARRIWPGEHGRRLEGLCCLLSGRAIA